MKKSIVSVIGLFCFNVAISPSCYARPVNLSTTHMNSYYAGLEGSATWPEHGHFVLNGIKSSAKKKHHAGGRFSAGFVHMVDSNFGAIAEIGGGYYGNTRYHHSTLRAKNSIDGYDVLVGVLYNPNPCYGFDLFANVGFMGQNVRSSVSRNMAVVIPGVVTFISTNKAKSNRTQMLPEAKVGLEYHLTNYLGITASYLHVFGEKPHAHATVSTAGGALVSTTKANIQNPSLNSVLFGIRFYVP